MQNWAQLRKLIFGSLLIIGAVILIATDNLQFQEIEEYALAFVLTFLGIMGKLIQAIITIISMYVGSKI